MPTRSGSPIRALTAAAAAKIGLDCIILHNANRPARIEGNLRLSHLFGAEISYLGPLNEAERQEAAEQTARELRKAGRRPYIIGDPVLGAVGYVGDADCRSDLGRARLRWPRRACMDRLRKDAKEWPAQH
jgi:1-aminocyclopropane-1-carboxylate deaminase/D-cysteine desulfhydrase-like pyridoxal-dependent ACC family enzyme